MVYLRLLLWHSFKVLPRLALKARKLLLLVSFAAVSSISGCTQQPSANITAQPVSNVSPEKNSAVRLGYQKGGVIPISRQRGELERDLLAQNIKVEWNGPFDRCASLLQAIVIELTSVLLELQELTAVQLLWWEHQNRWQKRCLITMKPG